jgi:hypothetical protein
MKTEDLKKAIDMLESQLKEEEESYVSALKNKKSALQLSNIKQRINSLQNMLHDISHNSNLPLKKAGLLHGESIILLN